MRPKVPALRLSCGASGPNWELSLIIREQHVGPLRRSARIRAPPVRLALSANGVQLEEISIEHFSAELHHALESDVSDLSASVLENNTEMDGTYDDDAGSSGSTSSFTSPLYTPDSAKSLSVQSGAGADAQNASNCYLVQAPVFTGMYWEFRVPRLAP